MNQPATAYHHGNLRQSLIDAALEHLQSGSVESLSLRALAREVGVSQTAPYRHFKDKTALVVELGVQGFNQLTNHIESAIAPFAKEPAQQIVAAGMGYIEFARMKPALFLLMFGRKTDETASHPELEAAGKRCFGVISGLVEAGIKKGDLIDQPIDRMTNAAWAMAHGLATLVVSGRDNPEACGSMVLEMESSLMLLVRGLLTPGTDLPPLKP